MIRPRPLIVTDPTAGCSTKGGCYWCDHRVFGHVRFVNGHGWIALCETCRMLADG